MWVSGAGRLWWPEPLPVDKGANACEARAVTDFSRRRALTWRFSVARRDTNDAAVLELGGRVGSRAARELASAAHAAVAERNGVVIVVLSEVDYLSSPGLAVLEDLHAACLVRGGRLILAGVAEPVRVALELGGLLPRLTIAETLDDAMRALATTI